MPRQEHWFACTLEGVVVLDAGRKRDVLDALDRRHPSLGLSSKVRSGLYEVDFEDSAYLVVSESVLAEKGWG